MVLALDDEHVTSMVMVDRGSFESFSCADEMHFGWWTFANDTTYNT
jgi:hypothetical protein